jgi:hypothetical protein
MAQRKKFADTAEIDSVYSLWIYCRNTFGTDDVRVIFKGERNEQMSKATPYVNTLTDGSEIFEVEVS